MSGATSTSTSGAGSSGLGSAEIVAALSAVIRAEEAPAIAELRLEEQERRSMSAAAQRFQSLMYDARALADQVAGAGVESELVNLYSIREDCWGCGRLVLASRLELATPCVVAFQCCMEPLRARGWRASGGVCDCGVDIGMGSIRGRRRCMHCALRFVRRRRG
jgi:hypothetical protein